MGQGPLAQHGASPQAEGAPAGQPVCPEQQQQQQQVQQDQQLPVQQAAAAAAEPEEPERVAVLAAAATVVQAGVRGWLARRRLAVERRQELEIMGMASPVDGGPSAALAGRLAALAGRRKQLQAERAAEMGAAMVSIKAGLRQREGWSMKERIRDKVGRWVGWGGRRGSQPERKAAQQQACSAGMRRPAWPVVVLHTISTLPSDPSFYAPPSS